MPIAVECYFSDDFSNQACEVWERIGSKLPKLGYRPHFSLAVFDDHVGVQALTPIVERFSKHLSEFTVKVVSLGAFCTDPAVLFLAISPDENLRDAHAQLNEQLLHHNLTPVSYYLPNNWTPHITLDQWLEYESLGKSVAVAAPLCQPLIGPAIVTKIGIIRCNPVEELWSRRLSHKPAQ